MQASSADYHVTITYQNGKTKTIDAQDYNESTRTITLTDGSIMQAPDSATIVCKENYNSAYFKKRLVLPTTKIYAGDSKKADCKLTVKYENGEKRTFYIDNADLVFLGNKAAKITNGKFVLFPSSAQLSVDFNTEKRNFTLVPILLTGAIIAILIVGIVKLHTNLQKRRNF